MSFFAFPLDDHELPPQSPPPPAPSELVVEDLEEIRTRDGLPEAYATALAYVDGVASWIDLVHPGHSFSCDMMKMLARQLGQQPPRHVP
jgi:hypothetical protein